MIFFKLFFFLDSEVNNVQMSVVDCGEWTDLCAAQLVTTVPFQPITTFPSVLLLRPQQPAQLYRGMLGSEALHRFIMMSDNMTFSWNPLGLLVQSFSFTDNYIFNTDFDLNLRTFYNLISLALFLVKFSLFFLCQNIYFVFCHVCIQTGASRPLRCCCPHKRKWHHFYRKHLTLSSQATGWTESWDYSGRRLKQVGGWNVDEYDKSWKSWRSLFTAIICVGLQKEAEEKTALHIVQIKLEKFNLLQKYSVENSCKVSEKSRNLWNDQKRAQCRKYLKWKQKHGKLAKMAEICWKMVKEYLRKTLTSVVGSTNSKFSSTISKALVHIFWSTSSKVHMLK